MDIQKEVTENQEQYIRFVANYLRKSRGEGTKDLDKHRSVLNELCEKNKWKYVEYSEIESGDSIAVRPVFQKLLKDIEDGLYDAVCVVDIDRLGRGDKGDQDRIQKTFMKTNTLIATPNKVYNLVDEDDEFVVDMKGFLARREYKMIVKRLSQGKKVGSKRGDWTNGTPPFPYEYERYKDAYNPKGLVVNEEKLKTYRYIIDCIVNEKISPGEIAWDLNRQGILSPRECQWHENTIYRIALDETHLGKIISNKTKGDGHIKKKPSSQPVEKLTKKEWVIVENCHRAVKTNEEHEEIIMFLNRKIKTPVRKTTVIKPLSGLIKCKKCGHTMNILTRSNRKTPECLKPCWYKDMYGNKCGNRGGSTQAIYDYIRIGLDEYEEELREEVSKDEGDEVSNIRTHMNKTLRDIELKEKALRRIQEAYEAEVYTISEFKTRKVIIDEDLVRLEDELREVSSQLKKESLITNQDRLNGIAVFKEKIKNDKLSDNEKNILYKSILRSLEWERIEDEIKIKANFI